MAPAAVWTVGAALATCGAVAATSPFDPARGRISDDDVQSVYDGGNSTLPSEVMGGPADFLASLPWTALLLPLVVGLGVIEATLLHATVLLLARSYKGRGGAWLATAACVGALAWAAQVALLAGLLAVSARARDALLRRAPPPGDGGGFAAFRVSLGVYVLEPILYATPVVAFIYWTVLTVANKYKRAKMKQMSIAVITETT